MSSEGKLNDQVIVDAQILVLDVFKSFRDELLGVFGKSEFTKKHDNSPVTVYDVEIENTLKSKLAEAYPYMGFEGEETGKSGNETTYWLVDPIDGTSSFIRGLPFSTNMAALVHDGKVVAAVIYDFLNDITYTAIKGKGAFKNDEPIHINTTRAANNFFVYTMRETNFAHVSEALHELGMRTFYPVGASGHQYMMLAEGKIDGIVHLTKGKGLHDNAPGVLICEEAGAVLLPYDDQNGVYRSQFIIGSPYVVDSIERSGLI